MTVEKAGLQLPLSIPTLKQGSCTLKVLRPREPWYDLLLVLPLTRGLGDTWEEVHMSTEDSTLTAAS